MFWGDYTGANLLFTHFDQVVDDLVETLQGSKKGHTVNIIEWTGKAAYILFYPSTIGYSAHIDNSSLSAIGRAVSCVL